MLADLNSILLIIVSLALWIQMLDNRSLKKKLAQRDPDTLDQSGAKDTLLKYLTDNGVCAVCGKMYDHDIDQPFASCACGTSEWAGRLTPYMQLQERLYFGIYKVDLIEEARHFVDEDLRSLRKTLTGIDSSNILAEENV